MALEKPALPTIEAVSHCLKAVESAHLAKNERDTRISCTRRQATAARAAFIEESRMKLINANKLHRKSAGYGAHRFLRDVTRWRVSLIPSKSRNIKDSVQKVD